MSDRAMPHQLAVRSGVIHPKYPAAPRQWVTYMGDQPEGGGSIPTPNLSSGVQRNFSRRWGGDAESRFPRLEGLGRAAMLGAIGKVLSQGINQQKSAPPTGRLPSPYGMKGPGSQQQPPAQGRQSAPYGGRHVNARTMPSAVADLDASIPNRMFADESEIPDFSGAIGGMKELGRGDSTIDAESWETAGALGSGMKALESGKQTTQPLTQAVGSFDQTTQPLPWDVESFDQTTQPLRKAVESFDQTTQPLPWAVGSFDQTTQPLTKGVRSFDQTTQPLRRAVQPLRRASEPLPRAVENIFADARRDDFASPALVAASSGLSKPKQRGGLNPVALKRIRRDLADATKNLL